MTTNLTKKILSFLEDYKLKDIRLIDVQGKCSFTDFFIISTASSSTHLKASSSLIANKLKKDTSYNFLSEDSSENWSVLDCGNIIIHIMHPESREYYQLEKLWETETYPQISPNASN